MKQKINRYIKIWKGRDYDEIPDEVPRNLERLCKAPSYRAIAIAILSNDHSMQSLGFTPKKSEYYNALKRIELKERGENV
jgi:predicted phosphoadenosine phosphosulfate sulfurtransferase